MLLSSALDICDMDNNRLSYPSSQLTDTGHSQQLNVENPGVFHDMSLPDASSLVKMRKNSYTEQPPSFSPSEGPWSGFHFSIENGPSNTSTASQSFAPHNHSHNHNHNLGNSQPVPSSSQSTWSPNKPSGSCTPTQGFEQAAAFDGGSCAFLQQSLPSSNQSSYDMMTGQPSQGYGRSTGLRESPQSSKIPWISSSTPDNLDLRATSQPQNVASPTLVGSGQVLRRDGIRKKNARFEIPAERNLRTIDQLINQTNDEQEIKELKQQKRLLRNRQAALDSRQRKKQHTERLEEEKKHYTSVINELEETLGEMKLQEAEWRREKESFVVSQQQYQQYIDTIMMEKEELVRRHTLESVELRKKNAILMEQLQRMDSTAMSAAPSSAGFSTDFSEFDNLTMNSWDDFSMANEFSIEVDPRGPPIPSGNRKGNSRDVTDVSTEYDGAISSGLLLMLLLYGAWMASRGSGPSTNLPSIPDEMRSASATVLESLYRDSGIHIDDSRSARHVNSGFHYPGGPVGPPAGTKSGPVSYSVKVAPQSQLHVLHDRLTVSSDQQLHEQEFSLTPAQYNDLALTDNYQMTITHPPEPSRTISEILASTRLPGGKIAETYTRSLMKDRVSTQILKEFAQMVAQANAPEQQLHWKAETVD